MIEVMFTQQRRDASRALIVTNSAQLFSAARDALSSEGFEPFFSPVVPTDAPDVELVLHDGTDADQLTLETDLARLLHVTGGERPIRLFTLVRRDQIDQAAAHLISTPATLLCEPHAKEWQFAFAGALNRSHLLHDRGSDEIARLHRLNEAIAEIANRLSKLSPDPVATMDSSLPATVSAADIRDVIRARRTRETIFKGGLLADPVWDMLLDLKASELEGTEVTTTSLCIASTAPTTTALRWIGILEKADLIERHPDPNDRRRMFIKLSARGSYNMSVYLKTVRRSGLPLA
jgi:hypothetical protein